MYQPEYFVAPRQPGVRPVDPPDYDGITFVYVFTQVLDPWIVPSPLQNVVLVVDNAQGFVPGMSIIIEGAGSFGVVSTDALNRMTVENLGYVSNAVPGASIAPGKITTTSLPGPKGDTGPMGPTGVPGQAYSNTTTAAFTAADPPTAQTLSLQSTSGLFAGVVLDINPVGYYQITGVSSGTQVTVVNAGTPGNAAAGTVSPSGSAVLGTGPQGPPGISATLNVGTTTTGAPGSAATVTASGTPSAQVFNFTIPRGDVGSQGLQGPAGATGPGGPTAVSTDAGNQSRLGSDSLIYTPGGVNGFMTKTAAYALTLGDRNKYVICSGGSWTLTLPAPALGLTFQVRNDMAISGTTGTITLQPTGGTIDGLASVALLPQQECTLITDGTNWRTRGLKREVILGTQDITSATASGTILLPIGYRYFELQLTGFIPVTNDDGLVCQFSTNGGSSWIASSYYYGALYNNSATTAAYVDVENTTSIPLTPSAWGAVTNAAAQSKAVIWPGNAAQWPTLEVDSGSRRSSLIQTKWQLYGLLGAPGLVNALKYFMSSGGNIANSFLTVKGIV